MPLRRPLILLLFATLAVAGWLAVGARRAPAQELDITPVCTPAPSNCSGWYRQDVTVNWALNPRVEEGTVIISCPNPMRLTVDTAGQPVWCEARYGADSLRRTKTMRLDKTAPTVTGASPNRAADGNGWYRNPVRVDFHGSDATSGIRSCSSVTYAQADSAQATVSGTCQDVAGNMSAAFPFALRYDATAPDITGVRLFRPPDHDGWYNRPVRSSFQATDSLSGLAECPPIAYDGAPGPASPLTGRCRDRAGNVATRVFPIPYDDTPPAPVLKARPGDRTVRVRIRVGADVRRIVVRRAPGRRGRSSSTLYRGRPKGFTDRRVRNGRRYRYTVTAVDQADNRGRRRVAAVPGPRVLAPAPGASLTTPPMLDWTRVRGARYYNVQLHRGNRKVLSAWPTKSRLQLQRRWRFAGRVRRLAPGSYTWQVWPGYGSQAAADFGPRIGRRSFTIR